MWKDLWSAVGWGSLDEVRALLDSGIDPNQKTKGLLPLVVAVRRHKPAVVDLLLLHGADPNLRDRADQNAVHCAVTVQDVDILHKLVAAGGDVFARFAPGNLIAVAVLWAGGESIIPTLVQFGVNVNEFNEDGMTPLMLAAANGAADAIPVLVSQGAALEIRDLVDGWTAYLHAVRYGTAAVEGLLLSLGANAAVVDKYGRNEDVVRDLRRKDE